MKTILLVAMFAIVSVSTAFADAKKGEELFNDKKKTKCAICHKFGKKKVGPDLAGTAAKLPEEWLRDWLVDPKKVWTDNDATTQDLKKRMKALKRKKTRHKPPKITVEMANDIIDFLKTK